MRKNVVLIGMPGSGKSCLGKAAAERTGALFLDADERIVQDTGLPIPEIFETEGEGGFRKRETAALRTIATEAGELENSGCGPLILATGGGVVTRPENREILQSIGTILYIYRSPEALQETCATEGGRPLLADPARFQELWEARKGLYPRWADKTFDADGTFAEAVYRLTEFLPLFFG
ncbi:MAG: shikimate kinase [Clostridiales bacterium]|nr:shikimate kinase [Clostridiales bacterium]